MKFKYGILIAVSVILLSCVGSASCAPQSKTPPGENAKDNYTMLAQALAPDSNHFAVATQIPTTKQDKFDAAVDLMNQVGIKIDTAAPVDQLVGKTVSIVETIPKWKDPTSIIMGIISLLSLIVAIIYKIKHSNLKAQLGAG